MQTTLVRKVKEILRFFTDLYRSFTEIVPLDGTANLQSVKPCKGLHHLRDGERLTKEDNLNVYSAVHQEAVSSTNLPGN